MLVKTLILLLFASVTTCGATKPPNVLVIVSDDLGYNDVSWHNKAIKTPNLERLANAGVILENHYVQPVCTPTRAALMTGYYPFHTGRQHSVIHPQEPDGLDAKFKLMPQYFKKIGYDTHAIGKWHLGFCNKKYLPTHRGFDTFYGYYVGSESYYKHTRRPSLGGGDPGYDFRNQDTPDESVKGNYSTEIFTEKAIEILKDYTGGNNANPFFMYLPFQSVHGPLKVPSKYTDMYPNILNKARKIFSGMVTAMDDGIGKIIKALQKNEDVYNNTIILFTSDNGGEVNSGGSNYPLRGNKNTLWEDGTRASSFIYAPKFLTPRVSKELIHVTDWIPTLIAAAQEGFHEKLDVDLGQMDGVNQWESLKDDTKNGKRVEMVYNIDPLHRRSNGNAAIRFRNMKLLVGNPGEPSNWIPAPKVMDLTPEDIMMLEQKSMDLSTPEDKQKVMLFDLDSDPTEHFDIASDNPAIVTELLDRLNSYKESMIQPSSHTMVEAGNPNNFGGFWSPGWC